MATKKGEVITFKVDESLARALEGIPNRSEFIRNSILNALENTCPLCRGIGILTPNQKNHWEEFSRRHSIEECAECHELYLTCHAEGGMHSSH
jgi:hypothetical protein